MRRMCIEALYRRPNTSKPAELGYVLPRDAPTMAYYNINRQRLHLSRAKQCLDEGGHLYPLWQAKPLRWYFIFSNSDRITDNRRYRPMQRRAGGPYLKLLPHDDLPEGRPKPEWRLALMSTLRRRASPRLHRGRGLWHVQAPRMRAMSSASRCGACCVLARGHNPAPSTGRRRRATIPGLRLVPLTMAAGCRATSPRSPFGRCHSWYSGTAGGSAARRPAPRR